MSRYSTGFCLPNARDTCGYGEAQFSDMKYTEFSKGEDPFSPDTTYSIETRDMSIRISQPSSGSSVEYFYNFKIPDEYYCEGGKMFNGESLELFAFNGDNEIVNLLDNNIEDFSGLSTGGIVFVPFTSQVIQAHFRFNLPDDTSSLIYLSLLTPYPETTGHSTYNSSSPNAERMSYNNPMFWGENGVLSNMLVDYQEEPEPSSFTVQEDISNSNIKYFVDNIEYQNGEIPSLKNLYMTVTAYDGYFFETFPRAIFYDNQANMCVEEFSISDSETDIDYPSNFYIDMSQFDLRENEGLLIRAYATIKLTPDPETGFTGNYGICTFYVPTIDNMRTIAGNRNTIVSLDTNSVIVDKADYIAKLIQIFMNVEVSDTETCILGGYNMGFECPSIESLIQYIEIGTFKIDEYFENAYDYTNTQVRLYLPFYGFYTLPITECMNKELHIFYRVHVATGDSVIFINDNSDNSVIETLETNIAFEIPYIVKGQAYDSANIFTNNKLLYGFDPFIEISRNKEQNSLSLTAYNDEFTTLKNAKGFCSCQTVINNIDCLEEEKKLIDDILTNGFII